MADPDPLQPGLMVVHGNRMEDLRGLAVAWMRRHPLAPLENETILVQSNGIAQWLRLALARPEDADEPGCGIAAALDVQLPARFLWQAYRAVLGDDEVPLESPFDKAPLTWRLMRLLPERVAADPETFAPLARFLHDDQDQRKRHQLAAQLADLLDQYQVYRADWLDDWARGEDLLRRADGRHEPLPEAQRWQAHLWRALLADIDDPDDRGGPSPGAARHSRAAAHTRFMAAVERLDQRPAGLPRRLIVFGISSLPRQALEALEALGRHCQVLLCVHNPCRYYWADIIAGRDLLRAEHRRQQRRSGMPALPDFANLHQHAHPLLAAWGRQGRDYIRLLDEHDNPESYRERLEALPWERIDLFTAPGPADGPATLLQQLQDDIHELRPLAETRAQWPAVSSGDDSIVFHVAHSPQREVEILHDRLLARFEADPTLRPRDVIVMVPDIDRHAPHIRAVFGNHPEDDPRHIPFTLSDQGPRGQDSLLIALEQLLHLPESRLTVSDLLDLLDTPALQRRFGLDATDRARLHPWIEGAGIRWGLNAEQRAALGLPAEAQNTWWFGLRRLLLGYAAGEAGPWHDIEPYAEVAGLDAALIGPLARLLERLEAWWHHLREEVTPAQWAERLRALLDDFFDPQEEAELQTVSQLQSRLEAWEGHCHTAGLAEPLPLTVVRESWLAAMDEGGLAQRFIAGAVNFATLMPMRAIPFRTVCLLGMDDGAYPRVPTPTDFDLMAGDYRPGDRSRREDDRYLLLEALLSARDQLHISWTGRDIRDNSEQPPSVLVGQLRDHLAAGWRPANGGDDGAEADPDAAGRRLLDQLTLHHPLQPFSRANFPAEADAPLFTYAREWRAAHDAVADPAESETEDTSGIGAGIDSGAAAAPAAESLAALTPEAPLAVHELAAFLKNPVEAFFKQRLGVFFEEEDEGSEDVEPLALEGLGRWQAREALLNASLSRIGDDDGGAAALEAGLDRLRRAGQLPPGAVGARIADDLRRESSELLERFAAWDALCPLVDPERLDGPRPFAFQTPLSSGTELTLEGWLDQLRHGPGAGDWRLLAQVSHWGLNQPPYRRYDRLTAPWVEHLLACANGQPLTTVVITGDASVQLAPLPAAAARGHLETLLDAWHRGQQQPLPVTCQSACTALEALSRERDPDPTVVKQYDGEGQHPGEGGRNPYLQRLYPDSERLRADGRFDTAMEALYRPLFEAIEEVTPPGDEEARKA